MRRAFTSRTGSLTYADTHRRSDANGEKMSNCLCVSVCVSLSDPEFVSSAFIEESQESNPTGDDDKIYFFFTEVAKEYDLYTKVKVPRVARVCKVTRRPDCAAD